MFSVKTVLPAMGILLLPLVALADTPPGSTGSIELRDRIMYHVQGWGELGDGVAAHARGANALPMQIKDTSYTSGLGTHAPSETIIALDGQFLYFEVEAGVQWQGGKSGSVVMQVFIDDEKVFDSGSITEFSPPSPLKIDVKDRNELRLVVTDASDGITCDAANWANPRLVSDPEAKAHSQQDEVDVAPFAVVRTWEPERMTGTGADRLEPIPGNELFLETDVLPDADGLYVAPSYADGRSCLGIEWLERRRIKRFELVFPDAAHMPENIVTQYWKMGSQNRPEGGSRWQGEWTPVVGTVSRDGARWTMEPDWANQPGVHTGALKVRWIFPESTAPIRLETIRAFSMSRFQIANLTLRVARAAPGTTGYVELYNGSWEGVNGLRTSWNLAKPLDVRVHYATPRPWQLTDRTVLRFTLPDGSFGVAVDDVVNHGPVDVEHAGLFVTADSQSRDIADFLNTSTQLKTRLEEVRSMPDQTFAQAREHVHIPEANFGPTMLSLANDNRKFVLQRNGTITFDNDPAVYNGIAGLPRPYACKLSVQFGNDSPADIQRRFQQDWRPIVVIERNADGLTLQQRTFVAPLDDPKPDAPVWLRERPLCVAEFKAINHRDDAAPVSFTLDISDTEPADVATVIRIEGRTAHAEKGGNLLALVESLDDALAVSNAGEHALRFEGTLPARSEARCVVLLPNWEGATRPDLPQAGTTDELVAKTERYWEQVLSEGMRIETPDPLLNNLIPASAMHCMMAARNDQGRTVAPWIAAISYGPWESEAQSVIRGMYAMGHRDFARRGLEYFIERYNEHGFLTTGYTTLGTGWHLWALGEYYSLTRDKNWLQQHAPEIDRVCRWVMAEREKTKKLDALGEKIPEYGLMPPSVLADWNAYNHYFYLNGNYYAGLQATGAALADIAWPGADAILKSAAELREEIRRAYAWIQSRAPVVPLLDGRWVPYYPTHVYSPSPIEYLYAGEDVGRSWCYDIELGAHHLVPLGVLDPASQQAGWIIDHMEDVQFFRPGWFQYTDEKANKADWFNLGGFAKVQPYYARTVEFHALRDDVKPFIRSYFNTIMSLLNEEDLSFWEHFVAGAYNKTHETGYFLHQTRLMFVQERGNTLWLAPFATDQWMQHGMSIAVKNAPTVFGNLEYTIASHVADGYVDVAIRPPEESLPESIVIRLRHPQGKNVRETEVTGASQVRVNAGDDTIHLIPEGGPITIRAIYRE